MSVPKAGETPALPTATTANPLAAPRQPVIWADVPDISMCRKGDKYYMSSTTMHFNPGIPVMVSTNLVDWSIASYCYETVENRPADRLDDGKDDYGHGTWASSIRYNEADGYFYVSSFNNGINATYIFRTKDPEADGWEFFRLAPKMYDHSLWIEDGKFSVLAAGKSRVTLYRLKDDLSGVEGEPKVVLESITDCVPTGKGLGEGCQLFKKDGWYYLFNICWPKGHCRLVTVHRARSLEGPWEGKVVFAHEGIAQGGICDTPDGQWFAYLFGDRGGVGRIPYIIPITWEDGWPVFPRKTGLTGLKTDLQDSVQALTSNPVNQKENPVNSVFSLPGIVASDEFDGGVLKKEWQFNHNPDPSHWRMTNGAFRITTSRVDADLLRAKNTLTQRTFGPVCEGAVKLDYSGLKPGDIAGLALFQKLYGFIGVEKTEAGANLVLWQNDVDAPDRHALRPGSHKSRKVLSMPISAPSAKHQAPSTIYLKAVCDFRPWPNPDYTGIPDHEDAARFYYSLDGEKWEAFGEAMYLPYTIPHFTGYRFALFCYATKEPGGHADFHWFRVGARASLPQCCGQDGRAPTDDTLLMPDGTNPIIKETFTPDPAAVVDGDTLYMFTGHDEPDARGYKMKNWQVFKTQDMVHWESLGRVMDTSVFKWAHQGNRAWASQAVKRGGKWYWYVAVQGNGRDARGDCIGVAVADRPEGPWTDGAGKPLASGRGYIDPSVFIDDDGQAWLFWGNCGGNPGCWYAPLKENMVELAGEIKPVPGLMDETAFGKPLKKKWGAGAYKPLDTNFEEAPWIYKVGDTYYLEYAAGGVPEYWAYSWAKSIHGPWHYGGKVMENAGGTGTIHGGSVFFKGEWYMVYHSGWLPGGGDCRRSACIERYTRNPDGTIPFIPATREGVSRPPSP